MEKTRISKLMSEQGLCSRREADVYIERGWVFVDGIRVEELGTKIFPHQKITLNRLGSDKQAALVTILLNKPIGFVSAQAEQNYRPAVSLVTEENYFSDPKNKLRFSSQHLRGLAPAGRLDIDSQGLLVLTQDGRVAKQLIGEDSTVKKEYLVRVNGKLDSAALRLLNHGLSLDGSPLKPATVTWQNSEQLRFILNQGKKRQIRRMCDMVGIKVLGLKRIAIGNVKLGSLPTGKWRYLREDERF